MKLAAERYGQSIGKPRILRQAGCRIVRVSLFCLAFRGLSAAAFAQSPAHDTSASSPRPLVTPSLPIPAREETASPSTNATSSKSDENFPFLTVVPSAVSGIVSIAAIFLTYMSTRRTLAANTKNTAAALWQKSNEVELKDIQDQIGNFYEVFLQTAAMSQLLSRELKSRQVKPASFALLRALLDTNWRANLSIADRTIVDEICANGEQLEKLILSRKVPIEPQLQPYFARAAAHFRILKLASSGSLGHDAEHFGLYIFPYQIRNVIELELKRLRSRQMTLRSNPASAPPAMPELVIPSDRDHQLPAWPDTPRDELPLITTA